MDSILVTVNLEGEISGLVKHVSFQKHTVALDGGFTITKNIKHTDRLPTPCCRTFIVSSEHVKSWVKDGCPYWVENADWNKFSNFQKVREHVKRFDEGLGVSFTFLNDGE